MGFIKSIEEIQAKQSETPAFYDAEAITVFVTVHGFY